MRALARRVAIEGDAFIYPLVRKLVVELLMRKEGEPDAAAITDAKAGLTRELVTLEHNIKGPFVTGDEPSAADFALHPFLAVLGRVIARRPEQQIGTAVSQRLKTWMACVEALPYFARTIPPHWKTS